MSVVLPALTVLVVSLLVGSAWGQAGPSAGELLQMLHAGGYVIHHARRDEGGLVVSPNENNRRARAFRAIVATSPAPGTNTLVVTHKPNILDVFGNDWFEVKEGEASIFKPDGSGNYALIARVQIGQWAEAKK